MSLFKSFERTAFKKLLRGALLRFDLRLDDAQPVLGQFSAIFSFRVLRIFGPYLLFGQHFNADYSLLLLGPLLRWIFGSCGI